MKYYIAFILLGDLVYLWRVIGATRYREKLLFMAVYHVAAYLPVYGRALGLY